MNNHFFALFGLPISFRIDETLLKARLLELQKTHHPDRQDGDSIAITQNASLINHAYDTLKRDDSRAAYLLSLNGEDIDLDKSISDWDFLGEMMEVRIALDDTDDKASLDKMANEVSQTSQALADGFDDAYQAQNWTTARDLAQKLQFVGKLHDDIIAKLSESLHQNNDDDDLYV
ncbi:Fe-S protein assembly co-chaperone HscB [Moraxella pluranimalium]|uniref:Fe-S protein assembly co-chaperone HscB n=1 Tax=Moraxella pluranimalium TaxID=470453 RepID=A0A1T0CMV8_9GAMM|nr:Fe-S protein assembly co-chaperone HscB [Moraxella pluranimalium]OOS23643.1 Fe-S protein assembly co-chaperone HscB [Moraxella pluranimalium]